MKNIFHCALTATVTLIVLGIVQAIVDGALTAGLNWLGQYLTFIGTDHKILPGHSLAVFVILTLVLFLANEKNRRDFGRFFMG